MNVTATAVSVLRNGGRIRVECACGRGWAEFSTMEDSLALAALGFVLGTIAGAASVFAAMTVTWVL